MIDFRYRLTFDMTFDLTFDSYMNPSFDPALHLDTMPYSSTLQTGHEVADNPAPINSVLGLVRWSLMKTGKEYKVSI